jgi:hypothetical protein
VTNERNVVAFHYNQTTNVWMPDTLYDRKLLDALGLAGGIANPGVDYSKVWRLKHGKQVGTGKNGRIVGFTDAEVDQVVDILNDVGYGLVLRDSRPQMESTLGGRRRPLKG